MRSSRASTGAGRLPARSTREGDARRLVRRGARAAHARGRGFATRARRARCWRAPGSAARAQPTCRSGGQRARARGLPAVRLRDAPTRTTTGRGRAMPMSMRSRRRDARAGRALGERRCARAAGCCATAESCTGGVVAGAITASPAVRTGSTAASSPIRTVPRSRCWGCRPQTIARAWRRVGSDGAGDGRGRAARERGRRRGRGHRHRRARRGARRRSRWARSASPGRARRERASRRATGGTATGTGRRGRAPRVGRDRRLAGPASRTPPEPRTVGRRIRPFAKPWIERSFYAIIGASTGTAFDRHAAATCRDANVALAIAPSTGHAMDDNKSKALAAALAQIEKQFGKGSIMKMGEAQIQNDLSVVSTGSLGLDIALGVGGLPRGRVVEIYGPGILRQDHAVPAGRRAGAEGRRHGRVHRCRKRARPGLCGQARRQRRRPADLAARHRRAGARNRRHAGALGRRRHHRHRLGCGAGAQGRNRRRDGRPAARPAGAADEPGAAQAHRRTSSARTRW